MVYHIYHPVYSWENLDIGATMMRHHFCEITIFSDRLYLQTFPGDFDSDLLQRKSYKEAESLATEPRKYQSST